MSVIGDRIHTVEGAGGTWCYHLSTTGENIQPALCGCKFVMSSSSPLTAWNMEPTHIRYKFCNKCHELAVAAGFKLPEATEKTLLF